VIYRIQSDRPDQEGATATVFFASESGEITFPGVTVPVSSTDTLAEIFERAAAARES
jgi:hypothetical protein